MSAFDLRGRTVGSHGKSNSGQAEIGILKLDESCISNSNLEISDWTDYRADWPIQFEISSFEFEMQDLSNFDSPTSPQRE